MKVLGGETNLNAPISVGSARVVRVFNSDSSNLLVTRKDESGTIVGNFMVPAGEVVYCEKDYTDTLEGSVNLKVARVAFSPMMSFVSQDSTVPTYTHSVSATNVDEGGNFTTTITTTNVADGTNLYWELTGVQSADFSSGALTGTVSISSNSATFSHTVSSDVTTEGTETATIKVYSDSGRNTQVGNTLTVTITDTSLTRTYSVAVSSTTRDEGDSFTTTMTTTNTPDGTVLYWELSGTGIAAGDFSSGALTGSGTISSNTFNFSHTIANDNATEGTETLNIKFYSDSGRTTQVGSTTSITINDTSVGDSGGIFGTMFNGGTKRLYIEPTSDFSFGTGDFTIEAYVLRTEDAYSYSRILHFGSYWNNDSAVGLNFDDGDHADKITFGSYYNRSQGSVPANGRVLVGTTTVVNDQWYHTAVTRKNGVFRLFVDGNLEDTESSITSRDLAADYNASGQNLTIANTVDRHVQEPIVAKISNVRITKGQCLYETDFQPSASGLSLTSQGATASNVKFLGVNKDDPTDTSVTPSTPIAYGVNSGDTNDDAYSPMSGNWSVDFTPESFLKIEHSTDFDLSGVDFTVECWYYPRSNPSWVGLVGQWPVSGYNVANSWLLEPVGSAMTFHFQRTAGSYGRVDAPGSLQTNQWQHCAAVCKDGDIKVFLNGSGSSWTSPSGTLQNTTSDLTIGGNVAPQYSSGWADGLISNVRITKGQCLYENNFTPSTSPLTTTSQGATESNVKLLCCNESIILYADVTPNDIDYGSNNFTDRNPKPTDTNPF